MKLFKKALLFFLTFGLILFSFTDYVEAHNSSYDKPEDQEQTQVHVYLFYGDGCPHCEKERQYLNEIDQEYGDSVQVHEYEVYYDSENVEILSEVTDNLNINSGGVPLFYPNIKPQTLVWG